MAMKQEYKLDDIPQFTYDAQATIKYYNQEGLIKPLDHTLVICVKEQVNSEDSALLKKNEMHINITDINKVMYGENKITGSCQIKINQQIDPKNQKLVTLWFRSLEQLTEFIRIVDEQEQKTTIFEEKRNKREAQEKERTRADRISFAKKALAFTALVSFGAYLLYKTKPTGFMSGFMNMFRSFNFSSIWKK
jgi:hypothetical protein